MERSDEDSSLNITETCTTDPEYLGVLALFNIVTLVLGQPMSARLLWITLCSKRPDVLNCNLALFHLLQYSLFYVHLFFLLIAPRFQAQFYKFIFVFIQVGDPVQLCFICLERFIAVVYPTHFPLLQKYKCREVCVVSVWILSLTLAVLFMFNESSKTLEAVAELLPISLMASLSCIMVFTSVKVAKVLRNPTVGKESIHPVKRRAFFTISVTSAVALSCYIPVMVMEKYSTENENLFKCKLIPLCLFFLSSANVVHPLFYLYAKGEFSCSRSTKPSS